jgi:hypothetical protein
MFNENQKQENLDDVKSDKRAIQRRLPLNGVYVAA